MRREDRGWCARIYVGASDRWHGQKMYTAIVLAARRHGLAGATVTRGIMGFGARGEIHESRTFSISGDLPIVIEIVDSEEKIRGLLPLLDGMIDEGMIMLSEVDIVVYRPE